jgi:hypothetical protein
MPSQRWRIKSVRFTEDPWRQQLNEIQGGSFPSGMAGRLERNREAGLPVQESKQIAQ